MNEIDVLKSYLVKLGFSVDAASYGKMQNTLKELSKAVESHTAAWSGHYVRAAGVIVSALSSITLATAGLMDHLAQSDMEFKKFALRMYMGEDAAKRMKIATDALGESLDDIAWIPELRERYTELISLEKQMAPPAGYDDQMKHLRDIRYEFTKLKVELAYGAQWVGSYLYKYLNTEIKDFHGWMERLNDWIVQNMPVWTEKVAGWLVTIKNLGVAAKKALGELKDKLEELWDKLDPDQKKTLKFIALLLLLGVMGPVGQAIVGLTILTGLIEDFYRWVNGDKGTSITLAPIWAEMLASIKAISNALEELTDAFALIQEGEFRKAGTMLKGMWNRVRESIKDMDAGSETEEEFLKWNRRAFVKKHHEWKAEAGYGHLSLLSDEEMKKIEEAHRSEFQEEDRRARQEYKERSQRYRKETKENMQEFLGKHPRWKDKHGTGPSGAGDSGLDGISRQESGGDYGAINPHSGAGGKYQIMPNTWRQFAPKAGLDPDAPRTPENQEKVAAYMHAYYSSRYNGDSRLIAAAWYGGEGAADSLQEGTMSQRAFTKKQKWGYPSFDEYIRGATGRSWDLENSTREEKAPQRPANEKIQQKREAKDTSADGSAQTWSDTFMRYIGGLGKRVDEYAEGLTSAQQNYRDMASRSYPGPGGAYDTSSISMADQTKALVDKMERMLTGSSSVEVGEININVNSTNASPEEIKAHVKSSIDELKVEADRARARAIREFSPVY